MKQTVARHTFDCVVDELQKAREALAAAQQETQKIAKELMDALNEPMYAGSRDDWKARALHAEQENVRLREMVSRPAIADRLDEIASLALRLLVKEKTRAESAEAQRDAMRAALSDLLGEVEAAGLGVATDFDWPKVVANARAALAALPAKEQ